MVLDRRQDIDGTCFGLARKPERPSIRFFHSETAKLLAIQEVFHRRDVPRVFADAV
jgi:hypothetical protein